MAVNKNLYGVCWVVALLHWGLKKGRQSVESVGLSWLDTESTSLRLPCAALIAKGRRVTSCITAPMRRATGRARTRFSTAPARARAGQYCTPTRELALGGQRTRCARCRRILAAATSGNRSRARGRAAASSHHLRAR